MLVDMVIWEMERPPMFLINIGGQYLLINHLLLFIVMDDDATASDRLWIGAVDIF